MRLIKNPHHPTYFVQIGPSAKDETNSEATKLAAVAVPPTSPPTPKESPPYRDELPPDYGSKPGEDIKAKFSKLEKIMSRRLREYSTKLNASKNDSDRKYYGDLVKAIQQDLKELRAGRKKGGAEDKVNLYNRLSYEFQLEVRYNVNLTSEGVEWSEEDLEELDKFLSSLPEKLVRLDPNLRNIRLEEQSPNIAGTNNNSGLISLGPDDVESIIHEIGHNLDNENPDWNEFQALSGWKDVTGLFKNITGDYDEDGAYIPYEGTAKLKKDGKVYKDGDKIDLDGDGVDDGIIQIQGGKVRIYSEEAEFASSYAKSNPMEDFAETFEAFFGGLNTAKWLKENCPEKFQFMVDFTGMDPTKPVAKPGMAMRI